MAISYYLRIEGNHENPVGNPIPYERMTARGKFVRRDAKRYIGWIDFVQKQWLSQVKAPLPSSKNFYWQLDVMIGFKGEHHADPDNVRKGVQDALFKLSGDKHVSGSVNFTHVDSTPYLDIWITPKISA